MKIGQLSDLGIVFALLPGLVTFLIVRLCTGRENIVRLCTGREKKIEVTEAILHGLAYTLLSNAIWQIAKIPPPLIPTPEIVGLSISAIVLGLIVSVGINRRIFYSTLRWLWITEQPEYPTIWETALKLRKEIGHYSVLELDDGRRIMGVIIAFSPDQSEGHVCMDCCQWLSCDSDLDTNEAIPISGRFMVPSKRILSVHFIPNSTKNEENNVEGPE